VTEAYAFCQITKKKVFLLGIDVKIVASENVEWLGTFENH